MFITTQGPLRITIEAFWKLIMIKDIKLVIMLTKTEEECRKKCEKYWPDTLEEPIVFEKFKIEFINEDYILDQAVIQRNFVIHDEEFDKKYNVTQLHVICWPDHSVPEKEIGFKTIELLISYVDDFRLCYQNSCVLVHCR